MRRGTGCAWVVLMVVLALSPGAAARSGSQASGQADKQFQAALQLEMVAGNLARAIEEYRKVATRQGVDRGLAAQALLRIAECYQKLGDDEAQKTYQEIVARYSDQTAIAATARARLTATGGFVSYDITDMTERDDYFGAIIPRISPDGRWIVFLQVHGSRNVDAPAVSIALRDLRTGAERVLVPNVKGDRPFTAWSQDSRRLAVSLRVADATSTRREMYVVNTAGNTRPVTFTTLSGSRQDIYGLFNGWVNTPWSANGRFFPYVSNAAAGGYEARLFDVTTGQSRVLASIEGGPATQGMLQPQLRWSADDADIAMQVGERATLRQIRVVRVADSQSRLIAMPGGGLPRGQMMKWTARGIVVRQAQPSPTQLSAISLLDTNTGQMRTVCEQTPSNTVRDSGAVASLRSTDTDVCLDVTPDGRTAVRWSVASERVVLRDTVTGRDTPLTSGAGEERFATLINDERTVVYLSNADGRWGIYAAPLERAPVAAPVLIARLDKLPSSLTLRPTTDGFVWNAAYWESSLARLNLDPATGRAIGEPVRLTQETDQNHSAAISPDGRRVAYWSRKSYRMGLSVMDASGANERVVVPTDQPTNHNYWASPVWTSNDELLYAVYSPRGDGDRSFFTLDLRSGAIVPRPFPELSAAPFANVYREWQYLPARQEMVFVVRKDPKAPAVFRARALGGGTERTLASLDLPVADLRDFLISPDGGRIAFLAQGRWQVYDVAARAVMTHIVNFGTPMDWSSDAASFLFDAGGGEIRTMTMATGRSEVVVPKGAAWSNPEAAGQDAYLSPDRSYAVLVLYANRNEWRQWHGVTAEAVLKAMGAGK